jgi:hypothetical protein
MAIPRLYPPREAGQDRDHAHDRYDAAFWENRRAMIEQADRTAGGLTQR